MAPVILDVRNAQDVRDIVHRAVQGLAEGNVVAFPTETVYALAASALNEQAVRRLMEIRSGAEDNPCALAIKSLDEALDYVPRLTHVCQRLARRCWPGPVTLRIPDNDPGSLLRQLPAAVQEWLRVERSVGYRVPAHRLILDAMRFLPGPLAVINANRPGQSLAVSADEVLRSLGPEVDMVLDDGRSQFAQPSSIVEVGERGFRMVRAGVVSGETLQRLSSMLILFVCTGNTCRSPMAEAICRQLVADRMKCRIDELEDRGVLVMSAGVSAAQGGGATPEAVEVMAEAGLDLSGHVPQQVNERLVRHADVIFTLTHGHRQALVSYWPDAAPRTFLLSPDQQDVADPIGGPRELYKRCADQIRAAITRRLDELNLPELKS